MAATDAKPIPLRATAYRHYFRIRKNDGTLLEEAWTGSAAVSSIDDAAEAATGTTVTQIGTTSRGYVELTAARMTSDCTGVKVTVTNTDALPYIVDLFPEDTGDIRVNVTQMANDVIDNDVIAADAIDEPQIADGAITDDKTPTLGLQSNLVTINGSIPAGAAIEDMFDGTGYAGGTVKLKVDGADIDTTLTASHGAGSWSAISSNPATLLGAEIATLTDQTTFTLATGSDQNDAYKDQLIILYDDSNSDYPCVRSVVAYTGSTKEVTIDSAPNFTLLDTDSVVILAAPISSDLGVIKTKCDTIISYTDFLPTRIPAGTEDNLANMDIEVSTRLASVDYTPASVDIAAIKAQTDKLTFTENNTVDATVMYMKDNAVTQDIADSWEFYYNVNPVTTKTVDNTGVPGTALTEAGIQSYLDSNPITVITDAASRTASQADMSALGPMITGIATDLVDGGRLDQLIDDIKAKTDLLTFDGAYLQAILYDITVATLAKYANTDSTEVTAVSGSVASLSKGSGSSSRNPF